MSRKGQAVSAVAQLPSGAPSTNYARNATFSIIILSLLSINNHRTLSNHYRIPSALQRIKFCLREQSCWVTDAHTSSHPSLDGLYLFLYLLPKALSPSLFPFCFDVDPWYLKAHAPRGPGLTRLWRSEGGGASCHNSTTSRCVTYRWVITLHRMQEAARDTFQRRMR